MMKVEFFMIPRLSNATSLVIPVTFPVGDGGFIPYLGNIVQCVQSASLRYSSTECKAYWAAGRHLHLVAVALWSSYEIGPRPSLPKGLGVVFLHPARYNYDVHNCTN